MTKLKKYSKVITFAVILVTVLCCIVIFYSDSMGVNTPPIQQSVSKQKQLLNWEAVKAIVEGRLTYKELYDTYYYYNSGSGFYIISFPIEYTDSYFLKMWFSQGITENPMAVKLYDESRNIILDLNKENLIQMMNSSKDNVNRPFSALFYNEIPAGNTNVKFKDKIEKTKNPRPLLEYEVKVLPQEVKIIEPVEEKAEELLSPEFIEWAKQRGEELKKPLTGLFITEMDVKQENGEVKLDFSLQNDSDEDLEIYFSSGQKFDIFITDQNNQEVYRWSHDKFFTQAIVDITLKKDERLLFSEVWDYKDNEGNKVSQGKYTITVKIFAKLKNRRKINNDEIVAIKDIIIEPLIIINNKEGAN